MSGVKNIIQQQTKGMKVPSNQEYRDVGLAKAKEAPKKSSPKKK